MTPEEKHSKRQIILSAIVSVVGVSVLVVLILLVGYIDGLEFYIKVLLLLFGISVFVACIIVAIILDYEVGSFECTKCGARFRPTMSEYIMGAHTITRRKLRCKECREVSFCKRRLKK